MTDQIKIQAMFSKWPTMNIYCIKISLSRFVSNLVSAHHQRTFECFRPSEFSMYQGMHVLMFSSLDYGVDNRVWTLPKCYCWSSRYFMPLKLANSLGKMQNNGIRVGIKKYDVTFLSERRPNQHIFFQFFCVALETWFQTHVPTLV